MKKSLISFVTALALFSPIAREAAAEGKGVATHAGSGGFYLGFSTDSTINPGAATVPSLSALFGLSDKLALQTYIGLSNHSPLSFAGGAMIKYTVVGDNSKGFHLGGGLGLGTISSDFFISFGGNLGFHFAIVESVMIAVDGGVGVQIGTGTAPTLVKVGGNGTNLLGMSLLFRL